MSTNILSATLANDESVDLMLQLIVELDYYDVHAIRHFANRPFHERAIIAGTLRNQLPKDKRIAVMKRFYEIERLTVLFKADEAAK
jgi:hypothetical protein